MATTSTFPVSLYASVGDTIVFSAPADAPGTVATVTAVQDALGRQPDTQPGAFNLSLTSAAGSASLSLTGPMVGRNYLIVDTVAGHQSKLGQIIVRARSDTQVVVSKSLAPTATSVHIDVGDQVVWLCPTCAQADRAWIAEADRAGNVLPSPQPPFEMGPRATAYAKRFDRPGIFFYVSPLMPNVRGIVTVGVPNDAIDRLPQRNVDLQCSCVWPVDVPCAVPVAPPAPQPPVETLPALPVPTTIPAALPCPTCTTVDGFGNVRFVSSVYGSDCPPSDGSASRPFRSIGHAVCAATAGSLVVVQMQGTFDEDMLVWDSCASCVQFVLEDRVDSAELGTATLRSGGLVFLRKESPQWAGNTINLRWYNTHRFSKLVNNSAVLPVFG